MEARNFILALVLGMASSLASSRGVPSSKWSDSDLSRILVAGGNVGAPHYWTDVEVLDLPSIGANCTHPTDIPGEEAAHAVGAYFNGQAVICSGAKYASSCHVYDPRVNAWFELPDSMTHARYLASSVVIDDNTWWISGGKNGDDESTDDSDIMRADGTIESGPKLVEPVYYHCAVNINSTHSVVAGGKKTQFGDATRNVWMIEWATQRWTRLPSMISAKAGHVCGMAKNRDGESELVVIGGGEYQVEIFSFSEYGWKIGPTLPDHKYSSIYDASLVQGEDTFVLAGGTISATISDKLYTYDPYEADGWREEYNTMTYGRSTFIAMPYPDENIVCT